MQYNSFNFVHPLLSILRQVVWIDLITFSIVFLFLVTIHG